MVISNGVKIVMLVMPEN